MACRGRVDTVGLAGRILGRVADIGDGEYHSSLEIDNGRISLEPALVLIPDVPLDGTDESAWERRLDRLAAIISETIRFCREEGLKLTVKSGGHGASGYCLNHGGAVIDLKHFDWIRFDRAQERLRVGVGQRFRRIYDYLEMTRSGLVPVGGGCPTVGLGGFLLGGGYSFLSRSFGLGSDNVTRFRVVTANGSVRDAGVDSTGTDRELFWGLCGAGGGNFGIVIEAEIQCHKPAATTLLVGNILFSFHRLPEVLSFYNEWVERLPDAMAVYGYLGNQPDPRMPGEAPLMLRLTPVFNGDFGEGVALLSDLLDLGPASVQLYNMTIHEWEDLIASGTEVRGRSAYVKSVVLDPETMTHSVADVFMHYMNRRPSPDSFVVWTHAGGAIPNIAPDATAFPHRQARFIPEVKAIWPSDRPEQMRPNVEWACRFFEALAPFSSGAYVNYIDPLQQDWKNRYYGRNYDRLLTLQKSVDPDGFFTFQQGIGSTFEPDLSQPLNLAPLNRTHCKQSDPTEGR